jgi:ribosomal protein L37AE/L43A
MISTSEKTYFLSTSEQQLLLLCHEQKSISFTNQTIYTNQRSFNRVISRLVKGGLLILEKMLSKNGFLNYYELSLKGSMFIKIFLEFINSSYGKSYNEFYKKRLNLLPITNRDYKKCTICKKPAEVIHHFDKNPENNNKKNLIPLCNNCHHNVHVKNSKEFY